jgi:glycosyltransferase involved in cell wall biosynthesis
MKTVAFILPSLAGGGAERVMLTFARALDRERFRVVLILLTDAGPLGSLIAPDIELIVLDRPRVRAALPRLWSTLRRLRPQVVFATMAYLNMALLGLRPVLPGTIRYVVREANTPSAIAGQGVKRALYGWGYRHLYRRAHRVLAPAHFVRDELVAAGVPKSLVSVLYNPVDVDAVRAAGRAPSRVTGPGRRFVAAGRIAEQKGFDRLVGMASALDPEDRITVYGDGPLRSRLEADAARRGVAERITFAGFTEDLAPWIAGADAFLLPSRWEGLPNVILESLALGTPAIATPEAGAIDEIRARAAPGAVELASGGPAFEASMKAVDPKPERNLRPTLLPDVFRLSAAVSHLESILDS